MTSVVDSHSLQATNLNFLKFQHDSRLYKGISVHVCIYLFMCNLMGIVNMVRLLKLLFYLSGASCFSGFEYSVSYSSCDFMVLRKTEVWGILFLWDISIQPSCSMLRRHWSKWTNWIEINFHFSLYISSLFRFLFETEHRWHPEENLFYLCFYFRFYTSFYVLCQSESPLVLSLKHHKSNKWNIVFF